jgi:alanine dehydrogenase
MRTLVVGVPSEIKDNEKRGALTPDGVVELLHPHVLTGLITAVGFLTALAVHLAGA